MRRARDSDTSLLQPIAGQVADRLADGCGRVGARGVLERHKLFPSAGFDYGPTLGQRQDIENEHLKLQRIFTCRLDQLSVLVEIRYLFVGNMKRDLQTIARQSAQKIDGEEVNRGAAGPDA